MGCWKSKELEERYSLGMEAKFLLCNACRKTHLTKTVIPGFERRARQSAATIDRTMQQKLRDSTSVRFSLPCVSLASPSAFFLFFWSHLISNPKFDRDGGGVDCPQQRRRRDPTFRHVAQPR
jgi:hypothetical protein